MMPVVNWPPATAPAWPPPELSNTWLSASDLRSLIVALRVRRRGQADEVFTQSAPTTAEQSAFFQGVRCDENHTVIGRMLINPTGTTRYPFAVCTKAAHRQLLVLWGPDYCMGKGSGEE